MAATARPSCTSAPVVVRPRAHRRPAVAARFLREFAAHVLASASGAAAAAPSAPSPPPCPPMSDADYEALLEKGRERTMDAPRGQLLGRAGRRCTLEDGERYLLRAARERPRDLRARLLLLRNLMRQAMGREREVPGLALEALRQAVDASSGMGAAEAEAADREGANEGGGDGDGDGLEACSAEELGDPSCVPALQVVLLALKALHAQQPPRDVLDAAAALAAKQGKGGAGSGDPAADAVADWRARRLRAFVEAAGDEVPGLAREFAAVERRLRRQLAALPSEDARLRTLVSREWLSAVDLAPPCGVIG